ncbi:MAG: hypothetical protein Q4A58_00030 [Fusobacterium sp.]|uniref:hypothetical protein n=1 Tax=Fusobacterium sp. TaxID=68766 RepID=UPI0026DC0E96|nr:hypothetical protein [Fusobacterium sp.]MDO4689675.1 hypothetical protein [Fusobacterium sp.]
MKELRESLDHFYSRDLCEKLYDVYLKDWIADGYIGEKLNIFELSMVDERTHKDFFIDLIFEVYANENKFKVLYEKLDETVKFLFEKLAWDREYKIDISKENNFLEKDEERNSFDLDKKYCFFKFRLEGTNDAAIYLEQDLAYFFRKYMKKPKDYYLHDVSAKLENNSKLYRDDNEKEFLNNMSLYLEFAKSGLIRISESDKILKEVKKDLQKHCNITEYYGDQKGLSYLKTENIAMFFVLLSEEYKNEKYFNPSNIKNIINDFIDCQNIVKDKNYIYSILFLNYIKGIKNIWKNKENLKAAVEILISLLKEMKEDDCLDVENIIKAYIYRGDKTELIKFKDIKDYAYINEANYERTKIIKYEDYEEFVIEPFVKSYLFLLGTLGLFEIFYTKPENSSKLYLKNGYLSQFNGLRYIRLTNLGKYIFSFKDTYAIPTNYEKPEIFLDDKRLIVTILGESPIRRMYFEKISKKIGNNIYKVTIDSFKRTIKSYAELKERIEKFKKNIGTADLPQNWQDFFENLIKKFSSIEEVEDFIVLKIKNDKELLEIIKKDARFKKLFLKAEDYHILVKKAEVDNLVKVLKEYGYHFDLSSNL